MSNDMQVFFRISQRRGDGLQSRRKHKQKAPEDSGRQAGTADGASLRLRPRINHFLSVMSRDFDNECQKKSEYARNFKIPEKFL